MNKTIRFNNCSVLLSSKNGLERIDVSSLIRDPGDFHGPTDVDQVVDFGQAMNDLIGVYEASDDFYKQHDISVLSHVNDEAKKIVTEVDGLARQLIKNPQLYDDKNFCKQYYELAKQGYELLQEPDESLIPVSLIRAGLVTTRLAIKSGMNEAVAAEIKVETKRAHPKDGLHTDLMVTVRWEHQDDPMKLKGKDILIADFVNPASWASTAALLLVLKHCYDAAPRSVEHRSFMATAQGVDLARRACAELGIETTFSLVGITNEMNDNYYLSGPLAVADAGHALRHFLPHL
jgi:hypothetical protein